MGVNRGETASDRGTSPHSPEFGVGNPNANCPPGFPKNTAQNLPKRAISSEKLNFYEEGLVAWRWR